ncbi:MAG: UPF0104 family protein [Microcystis aeruginosa Ma_QC_C_20070823_S13]|nr:UPF0104 family protein [Microcystis aeruginosa G13-11]NCS07996.1 UPF0104 family protein [Microcystis aeruginosa G13-07]TRU56419.1 MAG: UPF0104 family protein [Microcystis aeruginosa Ma_QC_C_20070823_S13]TRU64418.1 MAG: UPF0104 family protein [Microcystis aeruginosa Ma_QC_C_20070823_S13D]
MNKGKNEMLKKFLRWLIIGGTLFFVLSNLKNNWDNVTSVRIENHGWLFLFLALVTTIIAQIWAGWVWTWILKSYQQTIKPSTGIGIYMITNLGKYLPGNIGHFYARIVAINKAGSDWGTASLSVVLELLLLVCAALAIAVIGSGLGWMKSSSSLGIQILVLGLILIGIHPKFLNYPLKILSQKKKIAQEPVYLTKYPLVPLLGETGFLLWRGAGFILAWMVLKMITPAQILPLLGTFSFAWLLGLVVPGAPGGLGVFEATVIALLDAEKFPAANVLITVAIYRLISILSEVIAAGIGTKLVKDKAKFFG